MIIFGKLKWSNLFSYGPDNEIDFSADALTQIIGRNGHGKSSIALILEEVLFNKNSKGIKKSDILNRNGKAKSYAISLDFVSGADNYRISTTRGSTQTVKLERNGVDISSHTATGTFKLLEDILGFDHKTFSQIVYQSSAASLEFLTATDGNRKKFLIDLLNLSKYTEAAEVFKCVAKDVSDRATVVRTRIASADDWLKQYSGMNMNVEALLEVPESPRSLVEEAVRTRAKIQSIDASNKQILDNNKYKELLDATPVKTTIEKPVKPAPVQPAVQQLNTEAAQTMRVAQAAIDKVRKLGKVCITCAQPIDESMVHSIINERTYEYDEAKAQFDSTGEQLDIAARDLREFDRLMKIWSKEEQNRVAYEKYHNLYNPDLGPSLLDKDELDALVKSNEATIKNIEARIQQVTLANAKSVAHNAKIQLIESQMQDMRAAASVNREELEKISARLASLQVLVKTFSPTGLVAYKIECLIKDLEDTTNLYLTEISSGRFQLGFKIAAADKLNVVITDNGIDIDIAALSGGERARVNTAALLGIRKLMQSLSNTRINLLFLDETIDNLDVDGKEKLVEILLAEEHLNTFVISHGFTHPLLEKITVVKTNNISRIE